MSSDFKNANQISEGQTIGGETWAQWAKAQFEFENCEECGQDETGHLPAIVMGNWFAYCKAPIGNVWPTPKVKQERRNDSPTNHEQAYWNYRFWSLQYLSASTDKQRRDSGQMLNKAIEFLQRFPAARDLDKQIHHSSKGI